MADDDDLPGLAWPAPDTGPVPPPEYHATEPERVYRPPLPLWDRVKFLFVLAALWGLLLWQLKSDNPIITWEDAVRETWHTKWWVAALAGVELVRQLHYLVSERWSRYHRFWALGVFGRFERRVGRLNDWNRYRLARALKFAAFLVLLSVLLAGLYDESPPAALFGLPARLWDAAPWIIQLAFAFLFVAVQFLGIFWLLSRGGTEVYFPDDIKTRFSDVWGQDAVLERVKENIVFLEEPEKIEAKGGYVPGGILLWGPPGTGKGQPVSATVMTPRGPRRMGDLLPGDEVVGADGRPTRVLEVHLLGERDLFRVAFSDGSSLLVTEDHLWKVSSRYGGTKVVDTATLATRLTEADGRERYRIPMTAPVEFEARDLPLHPYLLGALLGDGTFRHELAISSADLEILAKVEVLLPDGDSLVRKSAYDWKIIGGATRTMIKELGLFGRYSYEKFVPEDYLWSSTDDRLHLLRGLMDTDGHIDGRGVVEYHTSSRQLADDVRFLVESLGGTCTTTTRETRYSHRGRSLRGRPIHLVRMALPPTIVPVTLPRKVERVRPRTGYFPSRRMVSIAAEGREEARCIRVEAPDHLYVTERFIVTHNTLMAEAVAGETGKPYVFVDPGAFQNMFFGVGILKVKALFRKLRKLALRYGGVIVFFDEADSLGSRGMLQPGPFGGTAFSPASIAHGCNGLSYLEPPTVATLLRAEQERFVMGAGMGGGGMGTLQALLTELSGLKKPRGFLNRVVRRALGMRPKAPPKYRILVMMATNMPQALDEALLRPGRIDRIYKVGYPSKAGRVRTYEGYLAKVRHGLTAEEIDRLATITPYATGASIKDLVNEALICAIRDGRDRIEWRDVVRAKQLKDLGPPEDVEYIERERHAVAVHEACHAVIAYRVRHHLTIDIATIEKGGTYLGMVASIPPEDQFTRWRTEYEADIMVSLASLAGERLFFDGDNSSGVSGDLESATQLATLMEGYWGMGSTVASHGVTQKVGISGGGKPGEGGDGKRGGGKDRNLLEGTLGTRIEQKLADLLARTEKTLARDEAMVLAVAHALETHKTVTGEDIEAIIEGREGPLIDGRAYHHPQFLEVAQAYHRGAVDAHKGHGRIELPLPSLPPADEVPARNGKRATRKRTS